MLEYVGVGILAPETEIPVGRRRHIQEGMAKMDSERSGTAVGDVQRNQDECHFVHTKKDGFSGLDFQRGRCLEMATGQEQQEGKRRKDPFQGKESLSKPHSIPLPVTSVFRTLMFAGWQMMSDNEYSLRTGLDYIQPQPPPQQLPPDDDEGPAATSCEPPFQGSPMLELLKAEGSFLRSRLLHSGQEVSPGPT